MIFVTTGHQEPFDRLVRAVDDWARRRSRTDLLAQVGRGAYVPAACRWVRWLDPVAFRQVMQDSTVVVSHAGTGTIITALELGKTLLVMPRRAMLKETRNDHQVATARYFADAGYVVAASDAAALSQELDRLGELGVAKRNAPGVSAALIQRLRSEIFGRAR